MRGIEIKQIKLVRAISEIGNLTRAARNLNISQPALSQQLLELEDYIGRPLFQRTKKRMILTETGESFLIQGEKVLAEMRLLESFVDRFSMGESGKLRISIDATMCIVWLPGVMKKFRELYPNVEVHILNVQDSLTDLRSHNIEYEATRHRCIERDNDIIVGHSRGRGERDNWIQSCVDPFDFGDNQGQGQVAVQLIVGKAIELVVNHYGPSCGIHVDFYSNSDRKTQLVRPYRNESAACSSLDPAVR